MMTTRPRLFRFARRNTAALSGNGARQFALSHAMCIYQPTAIYSFIPKNACSTLRFSVALANGCVSGDSDVNWIHENNETFKAWRFQAQTGYSTDPDDLTFRTFVERIPQVLRRNEHWRPQADFVIYENYDDWFCVEDFGRAVETLRDRIGFEVRDTRHLLDHGTYRHKLIDRDSGSADMPVRDIAAMKRSGVPPAIESLFDDTIRAAVRSAYADDFALYQKRIGRPCLFA